MLNATVTGTFAHIIPAVPNEGLAWDTTELYTNGILRIVEDETSSVKAAHRPQSTVRSQVYDLQGRQTVGGKSVRIVRSVGADGTVTTRKVLP